MLAQAHVRARFLQAYLLVIDNFAFELFHHACLRDAFKDPLVRRNRSRE